MGTRILVAFASKHGSTREVAEAIGRTFAAAGLEPDVRPVGVVRDVSAYHAVVLGSALYAAHWRREANRFVARFLPALQARPVWLFSSGPLDRSADAGTLPAAPSVAATIAPIGARGHRTFGGCLRADMPGLDPQILATHPVGDFRDWEAIQSWAAGIARDLAAEPSGR